MSGCGVNTEGDFHHYILSQGANKYAVIKRCLVHACDSDYGRVGGVLGRNAQQVDQPPLCSIMNKEFSGVFSNMYKDVYTVLVFFTFSFQFYL